MITFKIKQESKIKGFSNTYECVFRDKEVSGIDHLCSPLIDGGKSVMLSYSKKTKKINELIKLFKQLGEEGYFEVTETNSSFIKECNELFNKNYIGNINIQTGKDSTTKIHTTHEGNVVIIRIKEGGK